MLTELERELLPCPFCGTAEPQVVEKYAFTKQSKWSVICNGHWCDASVSSDGSGSLESAIETWNRRTDAAAQTVVIPEPSDADVELAWSTLRSTTQPRDSCACDGDMRAVLSGFAARLRERVGQAPWGDGDA